jgi:hypothetical protein
MDSLYFLYLLFCGDTYFALKSKTREATEYSHPSMTLPAESITVSVYAVYDVRR